MLEDIVVAGRLVTRVIEVRVYEDRAERLRQGTAEQNGRSR